MSKKNITIVEVKNYVGQEVTIGAWVANKSGKGKIAFLQLRDGSAFFQGVAFKPNFIEKFGEEEGLAKFDTIKKLSQETSVYVTGVVKEDERSKFSTQSTACQLGYNCQLVVQLVFGYRWLGIGGAASDYFCFRRQPLGCQS